MPQAQGPPEITLGAEMVLSIEDSTLDTAGAAGHERFRGEALLFAGSAYHVVRKRYKINRLLFVIEYAGYIL